ncbi:hypothetical protein [Methylomagnum sp.]
MQSWSIASPRHRRLSGAGLALLMGLAASSAWAENAAGAKPQAAAPVPAKAAPPAKPHPKFTGPAECTRTGQRVIAALARDDSGAASQFHTFYTAFKCPPQHLAQSFGCLVGLQTKNPSISNPSPEQVAQCWNDPSTIPEVKPPQPETPPAGEAK